MFYFQYFEKALTAFSFFLFHGRNLFLLLRNGYTLLLIARAKGYKICVFEIKILILHPIFALFVLKQRRKT